MTQQLTLRVHEYKRVNDGSKAVLTRLNPYIVLTQGSPDGGSTRVFIQNGCFFHEGGAEYKKHELPDWLPREIAKMSEAIKKSVGLVDPPNLPEED